MKKIITENKLIFTFFTLLFIGFMFLEFFGYSFGNTLSSELEKPSGNNYSHGLHHK